MDVLTSPKNSNVRWDRAIIAVALMAMAICLSLAYWGGLWRHKVRHANPIGEITTLVNDTRYRDGTSIAWQEAENEQTVALNDAVFTGTESGMTVKMNDGQVLKIGENSLLVFRRIGGFIVPDIDSGIMILRVDGTVQIAVHGELRTFEGSGGELQVIVAPGREPVFKVLRDHVKILPSHSEMLARQIPQSLGQVEDFIYNWRLHDIYDVSGNEITPRSQAPRSIQQPVRFNWTPSKEFARATVQLDSSNDFSNPVTFGGRSDSVSIGMVLTGQNHWRVSYNGKQWSAPQTFFVRTEFRHSQPQIRIDNPEVPLISGRAVGTLRLSDSENPIGFIVEESDRPDFTAPVLRRFWVGARMTLVSFKQRGKFYFRALSVNSAQQLSSWSATKEISVFRASRPLSPQLVNLDKAEAVVGEEIGFEYSSESKNSIVSVYNAKGTVVARFPSAKGTFRPLHAGSFSLSAVSIDEHGQRSAPSRMSRIRVKDKRAALKKRAVVVQQVPPKSAAPPAEEIPRYLRKPAQADPTIQTRTPSPLKPSEWGNNEAYKSSFLSLQGFLWTLQSSQQYIKHDDAPIATGAGLRGIRWWEQWGFEGILKNQVFPVNQAANTTSFRDIEARGHYRFYTPFPFRLARELQVSFYGGLDDFNNAGTNFSNHYSLLTVGNRLEFPVALNWSMGGEFIFGYGFDTTQKYEITGHFKYYFSRKWSLGFGYLLHFFKAGSDSSAPPGAMPYKEGYTEGFSTLDYHF